MTRVSSIFSQILQLIPRFEFESAVRKHDAERHARGFSSWGQFIAMLFCQLGHAQSLREICGGLAASEGKLRHLGLPTAPARSTLAYANEHRPWQLCQTVFEQLLAKCQTLAASQPGTKKKRKFRFKSPLLSLDASVIDLCATMFDWAKFRLTKGAVQLHLLLDHDGYLPSYAVITEGKKHEVRVARQMRCAPGTILVFDRGYTDYEWFASLIQQGVAHANEHRDWRIYADFAQILIATARDLYRDEPFGVELSETVYALDSTTIDLCLALFPWGKFRRHKSAVKLHTLLDLRGSIPTNVYVTGGQVHDVNILDQLLPEAGAFYLLDRGYVDFARLYLFTQACAFFITRARKDLQFYRRYSRPVERSVGLRCDQTVLLTGVRTAKRYPDPLRRIHYFDIEKDLRLTFLTNNFLLSALTIAQLYRARWQVELFFRWIKQHLRIKAFCGTSENAEKTQVWVAVSVYVLVAIIKKQLGLELSLYKILQILSVTVFEKPPF